MRLSLRKRALVALGLALTFVAGAAAPAQAVWLDSTSASIGGVSGTAEHHYSSPDLTQVAGSATKYRYDGADRVVCAETWVDLARTGLGSHRAPDVFIDCPSSDGSTYVGPLYAHWSGEAGPPYYSGQVYESYVEVNINVVTCRVEAVKGRFYRHLQDSDPNTVDNCAGSGIDVNSYNGISWEGLVALNNLNEPEHIYGRRDSLQSGQRLDAEDPLVSINARFHALMTASGNLEVWNVDKTDGPADHLCWSTSTTGNNYTTMQSDGNVVTYRYGGSWLWMTASFTGHNSTLVMGNDGNLFVWDNVANQPTWMTGTWGC